VNHLEGTKSATKITASVATNATHSHEIDTLGFEYLSVDVAISPFATVTASYANVLKLQQSDTAGSGQADVSGMAAVIGAGSTTGANVGAVARFNLDLKGVRRYVTVVCTPGGTAAVAVASSARLARGVEMPITASGAGVNSFVSG
jgi:hypothetical protein